ncbi:hypothetical protein AB0K64_15415 [Streptomyces sp. NPDC053741]|jgi:hypothetical protein|uniref:Lipoprotein n=1 Tax=[Kitasatospora] papulosa TaxID=1464011 RepID=A0ABZ1JV79_9ACTN|nr:MULTISPECIES: hypothetical protein [Streptomyces]MBD2830754.1 hypothetical protein [Streptomyces pratensis]RAS32610.1 hypothetical protein BCL80_104509 [Streptomyces avidinii]TPN26434.1 hypothetical protein FKO01_25800 [Mesorhizobium sp. B2-3-3]SNX76381.1 hypothetical protein SAMN05421860_102563 [Streptomyces microflavus]AGJ52830.1 hypothetical protein F750_0319 [Streptomyces sp. PAMC 26508]
MRRMVRLAVLPIAVALPLVGGCTLDSGTAGGRPTESPQPTATTTVAPDPAVRLADRYRISSGNKDVYGIQRADGPSGVPLLTVWTHSADEDAEPFDRLKVSLTDYLEREENVNLGKGYLMDVFGPDGSIQHRLDARP